MYRLERPFRAIRNNCVDVRMSFNKVKTHHDTMGQSFNKRLCDDDMEDFLSELNTIIERHRGIPRIDPDLDTGRWSWEEYDNHKEDLEAIFNDIKDLYSRFEDRRDWEVKVPSISVSAMSGIGGELEPDVVNISIISAFQTGGEPFVTRREEINESWFCERNPRDKFNTPEEYEAFRAGLTT